jgi:hypothetical protein
MLTETAGFLMLVPALLLFRAAITPTRRTPTAIALSAFSAGFCFLAIRARYTLGPAELVLLPFVFLITVPLPTLLTRRWRYGLIVFTSIATFAALIAVDIHQYGPFILPWVYDDSLVKTTRLYFHTDPPYEPFWVMMYVNAPLLGLPLAGIVWGKFSPGQPTPQWQMRLARYYALTILLGLLAPIALMARQQVSFQPRHLFAFSAIYACMLLLALPRLKWHRSIAIALAVGCSIVLAANIYSTLGPQRTTMAVPWPKTIAGILHHRTAPGAHPMLLHDLADGYFDWSDNDRVHDLLTVFDELSTKNSILIIDSNAPNAGAFGVLVTQFHQPFLWWDRNSNARDENVRRIQSELNAKTPMFMVTAPKQTSMLENSFQLHTVPVELYSSTLFRIDSFQEHSPICGSPRLACKTGAP